MNHFVRTITILGCAMGAITAANIGCTITVPGGLGINQDGGSTTTTTTTTDGDGGNPATSNDASAPDDEDAAPPLASSDAGPAPLGAPDSGLPPGCPVAVAPSIIPAWKPPVTSTTACSAADITALNTAINTAATYQDLYNGIPSATCKSCVFSSESDANYQIFVWSPNQAADAAFENLGACYSTVSTACGQTGFALDTCGTAACPDTCGDVATCQQAAISAGGTCSTEYNAYHAACTATTTVSSKCDTFIDSVKAVCGGG